MKRLKRTCLGDALLPSAGVCQAATLGGSLPADNPLSRDETAPLCSNLETTVINHGTNPRKGSSDAFQLRV